MATQRAWVTLALNNDLAISSMVLAQSLRNHGCRDTAHVLTTWHVSDALRENLHQVFDRVTVIDPEIVLNQLSDRCGVKRPDLAAIFTKLECWRLIQYEKCIFLEADCLIIKNSDELFTTYEEFSAAPDIRWPDIFSSSVFIFSPSIETYDNLVDFAAKHGSFDGGDQGLLNDYFVNWKRLPFVYNTSSSASYTQISAFKRFHEDIKILNFAGEVKPWHYKYNFISDNLANQRGGYFNIEHVRLWWNIFLAHVMPRLYKMPDSEKFVEPVSQATEAKVPIHYFYESLTYATMETHQPQASMETYVWQPPAVQQSQHFQPHVYQYHAPPPPPGVPQTYEPRFEVFYQQQPAVQHHAIREQYHGQAPPPALKHVPFVATITFNMEPIAYAFHGPPPPAEQYFQPSQPVPVIIEQRHRSLEPKAVAYNEQPWLPPELPNFVGAVLPAADKAACSQPPRIWPPMLSEVVRLLSDNADLNSEHLLQVLTNVVETVPHDILNQPLDKAAIYPSKNFARRLDHCPVCEESFSYLDEYFPIDESVLSTEVQAVLMENTDSVANEEPEANGFDHEDYEHKLAWEHGTIDYLGRDSWDNIMQHLLKSF